MAQYGWRSQYNVFGGGGGGGPVLIWHDPLTNPTTVSNYNIVTLGSGPTRGIGPTGLTVGGSNGAGFEFQLNAGLFPATLNNILMRLTVVSANTGTTNQSIVALTPKLFNGTNEIAGVLNASVNASSVGFYVAKAQAGGVTVVGGVDGGGGGSVTAPEVLQSIFLWNPVGLVVAQALRSDPTGLPWSAPVFTAGGALNKGNEPPGVLGIAANLTGTMQPSFDVVAWSGSPAFGGNTVVKDFYVYSLDGITA